MIRVIYNTTTKVIVTVLNVGDGQTVYPSTHSMIEDTEANIVDTAEAAGITDLQPILDFLGIE